MNDVIWLALIVAAMVGLVGEYCTRPTRVQCPSGYDLRTGVRRTGDFVCWPSPMGDPRYDGAVEGYPERSVQSNAVIGGRIYCTGGAVPIVVDYRTASCQRGLTR